MLFDKSSSLRRQLLSPIGQGGYAAPLRAYGKIPVSSEYVDVGCDALEAAAQFRAWISAGANTLYASRRDLPFALQDHRLIQTTASGAALVIACIWHSGDKRSEQGIQRPYPFSMFVVVPAPPRPWKLANVLGLAFPLWRQMEGLYPALLAALDRAECFARIRNESIAVTQHPEPVIRELLSDAADVGFESWLTAVTRGGNASEDPLASLRLTHADHWKSRGRRPEIWRFPISAGGDTAAQAAVWLSWLDANAKKPPADFCIFVPASSHDHGSRLCVLWRACRTQDFLLLAAPGLQAAPPAHLARTSAAVPAIEATSLAPAWNLSSVHSLRDLASFVAPIPARRWFSRGRTE